MRALYDAGALIAADHNDRAVWAAHRARLEAGLRPLTTAPVVAQVARSDRQALLHRLLSGCDVVPFAAADAAAVGRLLAASQTSDVVVAHVATTASVMRAVVVTTDVDDIAHLAAHLRTPVPIRRP